MSEETDATLLPDYKQALEAMRRDGLDYGKTFTHQWLCDAFLMKNPEKASSIQEYQALNMKYCNNITGLKRELLEEESIMLKSVPNIGYEVIHPQNQTEFAMDSAKNKMASLIRESLRKVTHVRLDELTDEQRRANNDAQMKLAGIANMNRKMLALK